MQQQETDNSGSAGSRFQPQGPVRILKRPSSQPSQMCQQALEANPDLLPDPSATVSSNSGKQQQQSPASSTTVLRPDSEPFIPRLQSQFASTPAAAAAAAAAATKSSKNSNSNNQATLSQS
uniref:Uncharacterized protein n=1 Tax=Macrostomum lignano TaxID=282301 RepID=A0A1I8JLE1_9PLAT